MSISTHWDAKAVEDELRGSVRGDVAFDRATRALYSTAACIYRVMPLGVVSPRDVSDVAAAVHVCRQHGVPITARGAGSGLAGQTLGDGLVLDFTPYMNRVLTVADDHVWVEPGLICDELNAAVDPSGTYFPPDPSSSGYCSIGGMIANNSAGSHSVKYGTTIDYVDELKVVLSDGTTAHLRPYTLDSPAWQRRMAEDTREAQIHRDTRQLVEHNAETIRAHLPRTTKNASGYRLERVIDDGVLNLSRLVCGSEGTLAIVVAAKLRILPRPGARRVAMLHFPKLADAGHAVLEILAMDPSAVEIHEQHTIDVIRQGRPELADLLAGPGEHQLFVEFDGPTDADAAAQLERMRARVCDDLGLATRCIEPATPDDTARLWAIRKATLPLLYNRPGPKRIISFIEDVTVPPAEIPHYIEGLYRIFDRHGVEAALYGHASQGNFHTRPFLDLHDPAEVDKMRVVADEVFDFTLSLGGTVSGEHGDGIARTEYLEKAYGPVVHLFADVKRIFDPDNLLNPGKKVPDPRRDYSLTSCLRFDTHYGSAPMGERLVWPNGGIAAEAERCHGCATCRTLPVATTRMCPVFKATGLEETSPRAKANLLREIAAGRLNGTEALRQLERVADHCLLCGSCKLECPSKVDVPKLMFEAKARLAAEGHRTLWRTLFARLDAASGLAAAFAPVANVLNRWAPTRWAMEQVLHVDRRRPLPPFARRPLHKRLARRPTTATGRQVVYFPDVFAEYSDPSIGEALVALLELANIRVVVPPVRGCGILAMCYGNVTTARHAIRHNIVQLRHYARQGLDILVTEPTALLCLREAYADFVGDADTREVAAHCHDAVAYVHSLLDTGKLAPDFHEVALTVAHHTPCHSRASGAGSMAAHLLAHVPSLSVVPVDEGCCGIAGSTGMRSDKYDLSMRIGQRLFDRIAADEFDAATTECSTCRMQIEHGTGKPCYHPLHLLAHAALATPLPSPVAT